MRKEEYLQQLEEDKLDKRNKFIDQITDAIKKTVEESLKNQHLQCPIFPTKEQQVDATKMVKWFHYLQIIVGVLALISVLQLFGISIRLVDVIPILTKLVSVI